jgi:CRP-like cAMP-binding protein
LPADPTFNRVLAALTQDHRRPWMEQLEQVELRANHELHAPGAGVQHIHFPTSALVMLTQSLALGSEAPVALVGNDGLLGMAAVLGGGLESSRAVVLHPGLAWRLPASAVCSPGADNAHVVGAAVVHLQSLTVQMSQTAFCRQHHPVEQRLCSWLLTALDRLPGHVLAMNLLELAPLLGASAEALERAAHELIVLGAIVCEPGRLVVVNRECLQTRACGCHTAGQQR